MRTDNAIYLIEGGRALQLVRQHIAAKREVNAANAAIAAELGVKEARTDFIGGQITAVRFPGPIPEGWTARHRSDGCSRPKKGTPWAERFAAQKRLPSQSQSIAEAFQVPLMVSYSNGDGEGSGIIGTPFSECGFLYLSADGPYALWIPDVQQCVSRLEAEGYRVDEPAKSFSMGLPGCRRLLQEEWDLLVAQHNLAAKRVEREGAAV